MDTKQQNAACPNASRLTEIFIGQYTRASEAQLALALAALLIKLGETSINITYDDVRRAQGTVVSIEPGIEGGVNFKIL